MLSNPHPLLKETLSLLLKHPIQTVSLSTHSKALTIIHLLLYNPWKAITLCFICAFNIFLFVLILFYNLYNLISKCYNVAD